MGKSRAIKYIREWEGFLGRRREGFGRGKITQEVVS
jgi:hypothetical protein